MRPAPPLRHGGYGGARPRGPGAPTFSGRPLPALGTRFAGARPTYGSTGAWRSHGWDRGRNHDHDRDHDRFEARRRSFASWYANLYPGWPVHGFSLLLDPGFYDWGETDISSNDQSDAASYNPAPYENYGENAPDAMPQAGFPTQAAPANAAYEQRASAQPVAPPAPSTEELLTVMFKDGRAPVRMQNYMVSAKVLTDLDARHYAQIPLDQVDVAATQRVNSAAGVGFVIPGAPRDSF